MKNVLMLFIFVAAVTACSSQSDNNIAPQKAEVDSELEQCQARGGEVQKAGLMQKPTCVVPYADAGIDCEDSSDCIGACLIFDTEIKPGDGVVGQCQQNNLPFGCYAKVSKGVAGPFICID